MHASAPVANGSWIWLIAGTGEGPPLAQALLQRGWRLRVWVVSAAARRAYPQAEGLRVEVGALGGVGPLLRAIDQARALGRAPCWVVDATHPFALRISGELAEACRRRQVPLLRLLRPPLAPGRAHVLSNLEDLRLRPLAGRSLLLAIGARQLASALAASPEARHHARLLPSAEALAQAMAAGLPPERVACLRPTAAGAIERALCRHWGIEAVLARQSGGAGEALWHRLAAELELELLLLARPPEPAGVIALEAEALLRRLGNPSQVPPVPAE
jgi:precorrin-6A/cobalt-precorrin-6A reductase